MKHKEAIQLIGESVQKRDAMTIAGYIINYCNSNIEILKTLKLQKLLYYVQAAFFVEDRGTMDNGI